MTEAEQLDVEIKRLQLQREQIALEDAQARRALARKVPVAAQAAGSVIVRTGGAFLRRLVTAVCFVLITAGVWLSFIGVSVVKTIIDSESTWAGFPHLFGQGLGYTFNWALLAVCAAALIGLCLPRRYV